MPIKVTCNSCGGVLHAPDDAAGKRGRCPTCGTVLTISGDAPRVSGAVGVPPPSVSGPLDAAARPIPAPMSAPPRPLGAPGPGPGLTEASAGIPVPSRSPGDPDAGRVPAFPRPPGGAVSSMGTGGGRMPPAPAKVSDPFVRPGRAPGDAAARDWAKARRGLGWVQTGVLFLFLAAAVCPAIELAGQAGVALPDKETGFLKQDGLTAANEIRLLATAVPLVLGLLCVTLGRLGAAAAPRSSYGGGIATAAAWATVFAFLGFAVVATFTGLVIANGNVPRVAPGQDVMKPDIKLQDRAERYVSGVFVDQSEPTGQAQRFGALAFVVFAVVAELWFLHALGRYAAALQSPGAARRVTGFQVLLGGLFALMILGLLAYDLLGQGWVNSEVRPKWNDLGEKGRAAVTAGVVLGVGLVVVVLYYRMLGGVKRAIRETIDTGPAA